GIEVQFPGATAAAQTSGSRCPQRALAAFFPISERSSAVSFFALAGPPFKPPRRPKDTAAGSFSRSGGFGLLGCDRRLMYVESSKRLETVGTSPGFQLTMTNARRQP